MARDNIARGLALQAAAWAPPVVGNWSALTPFCSVSGGAALAANTIRLYCIPLFRSQRISDMAARVTTLSASGNFQLALYANNPVTGRPTGGALVSTGNLSTTTATVVNGAVTAPATIPAGFVRVGLNQDNAVAAYQSIANGTFLMGAMVGSATLANVTGGTSATMLSLTVAQAFGTWPDLTAASFTESTTNLVCPAAFAKAA